MHRWAIIMGIVFGSSSVYADWSTCQGLGLTQGSPACKALKALEMYAWQADDQALVSGFDDSAQGPIDILALDVAQVERVAESAEATDRHCQGRHRPLLLKSPGKEFSGSTPTFEFTFHLVDARTPAQLKVAYMIDLESQTVLLEACHVIERGQHWISDAQNAFIQKALTLRVNHKARAGQGETAQDVTVYPLELLEPRLLLREDRRQARLAWATPEIPLGTGQWIEVPMRAMCSGETGVCLAKAYVFFPDPDDETLPQVMGIEAFGSKGLLLWELSAILRDFIFERTNDENTVDVSFDGDQGVLSTLRLDALDFEVVEVSDRLTRLIQGMGPKRQFDQGMKDAQTFPVSRQASGTRFVDVRFSGDPLPPEQGLHAVYEMAGDEVLTRVGVYVTKKP